MRRAASILRGAMLWASNQARGVWAVGRCVEELYRECEARGLVQSDVYELAMASVRRWCLGEGTPQDVLGDWMQLPGPQTTRQSTLRTPVDELCRMVLDFETRREMVSAGARSLVAIERAWIELGEPQAAARQRVARTLRASLEGKDEG